MSNKHIPIFLVVTVVIALSDAFLVWNNYQTARHALHQNLQDHAEKLQNTYKISLLQVSNFMRQTATYIANDTRVRDLFQAGRNAVEAEGGGQGAERAASIRAELYTLVESGWAEMTKNYKRRQLHFHLPPDISFLRVHRPEKFGDDLSTIRHSIMATNRTLQESMGFESGRVYAGIRGVVPVFSNPDQNGEKTHIGALEAGTSYSLMLQELHQVLSANFAVLMTLEHAQNTMWPDFLQEYSQTHPIVNNHLLEASTNNNESTAIIQQTAIQQLLSHSTTVLLALTQGYISVSSFPLRDYLGTQDPSRPDIGTVLTWKSADAEVAAFNEGIKQSIIIAVIGFIIVELLILIGIRSERHIQKQRYIALTDGLTSIPNRRHFDQRLKDELRRAKRNRQELALIIGDVDYFKPYNDFYGHVKGDDALSHIAQTLQNQLKRSTDFIARYGGEEFVILLPATNQQLAATVAERLRKAIENLALEHPKRPQPHMITMSFGVFSGTPAPNLKTSEAKQLIEHADQALYQAKSQGRNCVAVYQAD